VQGTIKDFNVGERTGTLLTDAQEEIAIDRGSLEGGGIRYLRVGQRVKFDVAEEGGHKVARTLRIVTMD
jgi:cold shock CspA family protein